eukprot:Rhum_TRINITY_DN21532_c0_g1::Rhum_TRINITY_DN21532_c0_g1_i1::g.174250::m.174250
MQVNADLSQPVSVDSTTLEWQPSPLKGVDRRMLERVGDEVAICATIVRYAPGSTFDAHTHAKGEEFVVLEGTFSDEHGSYPPGHYIRNPPGSSHAPFSEDGCTIFVRLRQFADTDTKRVVQDTHDMGHFSMFHMQAEFDNDKPAIVFVQPLHKHAEEVTYLLNIPKNTNLPKRTLKRIEEYLVLEGELLGVDGLRLPKHGWARIPKGEVVQFSAGNGGECIVLVREGRQLQPEL